MPKGRSAFVDLDARAGHDIATLSAATQNRLVEAMYTIERVLTQESEPNIPYVLRPHQSGGMGYIVYRQAVLYTQEYGWNAESSPLSADLALAGDACKNARVLRVSRDTIR